MKIAVITGGSSGIGRAAAKAFSRGGFRVYELSRSGKSDGEIIHITCDVTDENSVSEAFAYIYSEGKRLDVLVNNAGFGISGAVEFTDLEQAKKQFDVNFFGAVCCTKEAVKYMKKDQL